MSDYDSDDEFFKGVRHFKPVSASNQQIKGPEAEVGNEIPGMKRGFFPDTHTVLIEGVLNDTCFLGSGVLMPFLGHWKNLGDFNQYEYGFVLTAAHCIFDACKSSYFDKLRVKIPIMEQWKDVQECEGGRKPTKQKYKNMKVDVKHDTFIFDDYRHDKTALNGSDIALIKLPEVYVSSIVNPFCLWDPHHKNTGCGVGGFPGTPKHNYLPFTARSDSVTLEHEGAKHDLMLMKNKCNTLGGMSGGATLLFDEHGAKHIVGVHVAGSLNGDAVSTMLTPKIINWLQKEMIKVVTHMPNHTGNIEELCCLTVNPQEEWRAVLEEMKLMKFIPNFEDGGYDDVALFGAITDSQLKELGLKGGHILKFRARFEAPEEQVEEGHQEQLELEREMMKKAIEEETKRAFEEQSKKAQKLLEEQTKKSKKEVEEQTRKMEAKVKQQYEAEQRQKANTISFVDTDGDAIKFIKNHSDGLDYYVNGVRKVRDLTRLYSDVYGRLFLDGTSCGRWPSSRVTKPRDQAVLAKAVALFKSSRGATTRVTPARMGMAFHSHGMGPRRMYW